MDDQSRAWHFARRQKCIALDRARWEKSRGPAWRHKRERTVRDALYFREKMKQLRKS